jgi:Na+/H+ antiporter NhaD/arsenite permease-like protein
MSLPPALATAAHLGDALPAWSVVPFGLMLLAIAVLPLAAPAFWEHNRNKAVVSLALGLPVAVGVGRLDPGAMLHVAREYVAFILLLGSLFVIAGGIVVRGTLSGRPSLNAGLLGAGAVLASIVGTTGASMLLVRPVLRANAARPRRAHVLVFFIFLVSNVGGLLTPLGDPPLFLGFLRGVPFGWTLRLLPVWLLVVGALLAVFVAIDAAVARRDGLPPAAAGAPAARPSLAGGWNALWLAGVVALLLLTGSLGLPAGTFEAGLLLLAGLSWATTPRALRRENGFLWAPIVEVAVLFAGIFATMVPALHLLHARGASLGITEPWQFFWGSGILSSFLDNAPTYLTFASTASGLVGTDAADLGSLAAHPAGAPLLLAVSAGSVLMGANTYIGNGPNFMVKAIAEQDGVRMPGFFGYMAWSGAVLLPIFGAVTLAFFR